jgi:hypothetical protein
LRAVDVHQRGEILGPLPRSRVGCIRSRPDLSIEELPSVVENAQARFALLRENSEGSFLT